MTCIPMHVVVGPLIQCPKPNYNRLWALDDWYPRNCHMYRAFSCLWHHSANACDVLDQVSRHNKVSESTRISSEGRKVFERVLVSTVEQNRGVVASS